MFADRNNLIFGALAVWCLLFAAVATFTLKDRVSQRLEIIAFEALQTDADLATLQPHFRGLTGWFSGTATSPEQLETAYKVANRFLPAGAIRPQTMADFSAPKTAPVPELAEESAPGEAKGESAPTPAPPPAVPQDGAAPEPLPVALTNETRTSSSRTSTAPEESNASLSSETVAAASPPSNEATPSPEPVVTASPDPSPAIHPEPADEPAPAVAPSYVPEEWADIETPAPSDDLEVDEWAATIFFGADSSILQDSQRPTLKRVADECASRPGYTLQIVSFADPRGHQEYTYWLSQRRAVRVRTELHYLDVKLDMEIVVDNESAESPSLQDPEIERRVELRFVK